jgi:type IV secretory pathway ATPase VirB11/archaellum biosynthesis ATPase
VVSDEDRVERRVDQEPRPQRPGRAAPPGRPRIVIEDTAELQLEKPNLVRFEARRERPGAAALTIRALLEATVHRAGTR